MRFVSRGGSDFMDITIIRIKLKLKYSYIFSIFLL